MVQKLDIVIVGGGPAGISSAIWAKRLGMSHILLEARNELGGQLPSINNHIIDYPGNISINGSDLQKNLIQHAVDLKCSYKTNSSVESINWEEKKIITNDKIYIFRSLLIATGAKQRLLGISGEEDLVKLNQIYSTTRDKEKFKGKTVAVIGGGDRAFEGALLLANAGSQVYLIHHSNHFKARNEYKIPVFEHPEITILTNTVVSNIKGDFEKQLTLQQNERTAKLVVHGIFIRIGIEPITEPFKGGIELDQSGYIISKPTGETSLPYVYAAGDVCTKPFLSSVASSVGQGMIAVKCISSYLEQHSFVSET